MENTTMLHINGQDGSLRVNVNVHDFETAEEANAFATALHNILVSRHDYQGCVWVTDCAAGFFTGDLYKGDLPDAWSAEDAEAVYREAANAQA